MASSVKLTFNSTTYNVYCTSVQVGWNNNNTAKPRVNGGEAVEVQTHSFENPTYTLQGVHLTEGSSTLTYAALLSMSKNRYDGTNGITLTVDYGVDTPKLLLSSDGSTTAIPIVVKSFSFPIPVESVYNSSVHLPILTIVLQETA